MVRSIPKIWIESRITWRACGTVMPRLYMPSPDSFTCALGNAAMLASAPRHCSIIAGERGKRLDQLGCVGRLPGIHLQFETKAVLFQQCKSAAKFGGIAEVGLVNGLPHRIGIPI